MEFLKSLVDQVMQWPVSLVMVVALSFAGIAMKRAEWFPNKFIPSVLMLQGTILFILVSDPGHVQPGVRYPEVVEGLYGCILGAISWGIHGLTWKLMSDKLPGLKNGPTGDTEEFKKPEKPDK